MNTFRLLHKPITILMILFSSVCFAAPGKPSIAWMTESYSSPASYTIAWNMWWGENGNRWHLLENGVVIHSSDLAVNGNNAQSSSLSLTKSSGGEFNYLVKLCSGDIDSLVCTTSAEKSISVSGGSVNLPPVVNAGSDLTVEINVSTTLNGIFDDDGISTPVTANWQLISGPGIVSFVNQNQALTEATFTTEGSYILELSVSDPEFTVSDEITVVAVNEAVNQAPIVDAGVDLDGTVNELVQLNASYTDDGKTSPILVSWNKLSGPGVVTFSNSNDSQSTVLIDAVGSYILEYSVDDSEFIVKDQLTVDVTDVALPDQPGTPSMNWLASEVELVNGQANINFSWNLWWGVNGNTWRIVQNDDIVFSENIVASGSGAQSGSANLMITSVGIHNFKIQLCNVVGNREACSDSASKLINVFSSDGLPTTPGDFPYPLKEFNESYNNTTGKMVAAYFVEWGIYGRNYHVSDIPVENLTHIFYGFVPLCGPNESLRLDNPQSHAALMSQCEGKSDFEVVVHDKFAALDKLYPGDVDGKGIAGIFGQLQRMKLANPEVKIMPSVGGWTLSDPLYEVAINPEARATFIKSMIDYLRLYSFFDGVDIDWEFPGGGGLDGDLGSPSDGNGFADLMIELRVALDKLGEETGRTYQLTAAVSGGVPKLSKINWERSHAVMDYVNIMVYDYAGAWNNDLAHQANLYESELYPTTNVGFNGHDSIQHLLSRNVPSSKITMGVAMYGRGWKGVTGATNGNPFTGIGNGGISGTWQDGIEDYKTLEANYMNGPSQGANGFELSWDPVSKAEYLWNSATGTLISLDTVRSTVDKGQYVNQYNLGGVFAWELDGDNGRILNAMHQGLGHVKK